PRLARAHGGARRIHRARLALDRPRRRPAPRARAAACVGCRRDRPHVALRGRAAESGVSHRLRAAGRRGDFSLSLAAVHLRRGRGAHRGGRRSGGGSGAALVCERLRYDRTVARRKAGSERRRSGYTIPRLLCARGLLPGAARGICDSDARLRVRCRVPRCDLRSPACAAYLRAHRGRARPRALVDAHRGASSPAVLVDAATMQIVAESAALAEGGWPRTPALGRKLTEVLQLSSPEIVEELIAGAGGIAPEVTLRVGSELRMARVHVQHVAHRGRRFALVLMEDRTEAFAVRAALDAAEQATLVLDAEERVLAFNKPALALFSSARAGAEAEPLLALPDLPARWWEPGLTGRRKMH